MDRAARQLARYLLAAIVEDTGLHVTTRRVDDRWETLAVDLETGEQWRVRAPSLYDAACELATQVGLALDA